MNDRIIAIEKYYGSLPNMKAKYDKHARKDAFDGNGKDEFEAWRSKARAILSELIGLDKMEQVPLDARVEERVTVSNGIVREKVVIQTENDVWMPMYILIPPVTEVGKKLEVFIAPPGHQGAGKYSVAGCEEIPAVADAIRKFNYDYGMQLAKLGYVAVCPDCRGFGERRDEALQKDEESAFLSSTCFHLSHMALPMGETVAGMCAWDLMKLVDYLETRTEWDMTTLSCLGFSGAGMQTLYFATLDERIKRVCISGYMYGFNDSLMILNGNCNCNYVPHLWEHFDMGDIASMIAPRPMMIQSCREDHLNGPRGLQNVYEQMEIIQKAYALFDAENKVIHDIHEGGHCWHGDNLQEILEALAVDIK